LLNNPPTEFAFAIIFAVHYVVYFGVSEYITMIWLSMMDNKDRYDRPPKSPWLVVNSGIESIYQIEEGHQE
jgi:hypothetical protein